MASIEPTPDEAQDLRRCVRDLVALSTLPAIWDNAEPASIGRSLAEVLLRLLSADFIYVRLDGRASGTRGEALRTRQRMESPGRAHEIGQALASWLQTDYADTPTSIRSPLGDGTMRLAVFAIGHARDYGLLAAGCARLDFPTDAERLLLSVAANQAAGLLQRKQTEEALWKQSEWLRVTLASIGDAVITTDAGGHVTSLNPVAESLTGWAQQEAQGQPLSTVFRILNEQSRRPVEDPVAEVLREGRIVGLGNHTVLIARDGTERPIDDSAAPIRGAAGETLGVVLIFRDVTEQRQAERELRHADRLKDEFVAMLAHELRNPLAPIRNALHIMKQPGASGDTLQQVRDMAERQVQHMARLLDDLLDMSRISQGKIELRKEPLNTADVVSRVAETLRPLVEERRQELTISLPHKPVRVEADPTRLEQIITNLLNNAAKYTDLGGHIWLTVERRDREVAFRVRDTGIGIAEEMLPKIFDLFVQAERRLDRSQGGVGIGLTLVKRLVELHGGTIEAISQGLGEGSEFVVRLPALGEEPRSPGGSEQAVESSAVALPAYRVLVVDDNVDAADTLAILLQMMGQDVQVAHSGASGLALAQDFCPQVVFLDIGMPGMDGYEVCRRLRQQPGTEGAVVIALTGWGQDEDRRRSHDTGFDHHLVKPVEPDTLGELLAHPNLLQQETS